MGLDLANSGKPSASVRPQNGGGPGSTATVRRCMILGVQLSVDKKRSAAGGGKPTGGGGCCLLRGDISRVAMQRRRSLARQAHTAATLWEPMSLAAHPSLANQDQATAAGHWPISRISQDEGSSSTAGALESLVPTLYLTRRGGLAGLYWEISGSPAPDLFKRKSRPHRALQVIANDGLFPRPSLLLRVMFVPFERCARSPGPGRSDLVAHRPPQRQICFPPSLARPLKILPAHYP
jgi:hypothetical protein